MDALVTDLLAGNRDHAAAVQGQFDDLQTAQHPDAVTVCCSDSRVLQDEMWNSDDPGRLFTCGNIGNRVVHPVDGEPVVSGDVLYPLLYTGTRIVIVVGHTACGAVTAAYEDLREGRDDEPGLAACLDLLEVGLEAGVEKLPRDIDDERAVNLLVEHNVDRQIDHLRHSSHVPDGTRCIGVVYDFCDVYPGDRGEIHVINVDGETDVDRLRDEHGEIDDRIRRLWEYDHD